MGPVPQAYRPASARPPEKPDRFQWLTAVGWVMLAGLGVLVALFIYRAAAAGNRRAVEQAEMAREQEHFGKVIAWLQDTAATVTPPDSGSRPVPTSAGAKRVWVASRMLVDLMVREREVLRRHGVETNQPPNWWKPDYVSNARSYSHLGRYLEGHKAAIAELDASFAGWMQARAAALASASGMTAREILDLFPDDFRGVARVNAEVAEAMLAIHRHLVRVDPRVHPAPNNQQGWERESDLQRMEELVEALNAAQRRNLTMKRQLVQQLSALRDPESAEAP